MYKHRTKFLKENAKLHKKSVSYLITLRITVTEPEL